MIVLTAIGAFFKKIWDWIRQTAWIQPLLIVGIIFGVIFSIPAIVNAIKDAQSQSAAASNYYHKFQLSMEGAKNSEAYKVTDLIYKAQENPSDANVKALKDKVGTDKFFFVYVEDDCENCKTMSYGFDYLEKNWSTYGQKDEFKIISIFADEVTNETTSIKPAFGLYTDNFIHFFELAGEAAYNTDYYVHSKEITSVQIEAIEQANIEEMKTPTIFLIDFSKSAEVKGVSEVIVGAKGDSDASSSLVLLHCWNHTDEFSLNNKTI